MGPFVLLLLFSDGARPDLPRPKPEIRRYGTLAPLQKAAPPPAPAKKETAAERRKRLAEEKRMQAILKALGNEQQGALLGVLSSGTPSAELRGGVVGGTPAAPPPTSDREGIHRVVQAHVGAVRYCYEKELASKPDLKGRVLTRFTIDASGVVTDATIADSTLADTAVESCILRQIRSWRFPAKATTVTYPFRFEIGG